MDNKELKFLKYPPQRDVVFVLGAGASHPDGVPLQRHILPMIIEDKNGQIKNSLIGRQVLEFINENFSYSTQEKIYPNLEAVFGFLDYFIQQNESLNAKYTNSKLRDIKEYLIKLIHYVVNLETEKPSKYYRSFWEAVQKYNSNVSIITLNYDTLLEHAFEFLFKKFGYIDYCFHFMNFDENKRNEKFTKWLNPRQPIDIENGSEPVPIKILKIHGSLNWKYCNCCNQTLLTHWDRKIDLQKGKFLGYTYPDNQEYEFVCPLDGTEFQTVIMPPSYVKSLNHPVITQLLSEASREIRATKKIVFIGYSLSDADVHVKALFKKQMMDDIEVVVVNTKKEELLKLNYYSLSKKVTFIDCSFENLVTNDELMKSLLIK